VIEIREYVDSEGRSPYRDWLVRLEPATVARVIAAILRMESGSFSAAKSVGAGVSELRLDFGPGYRIYFGKDGEQLVILLAGGTKKRQQADIDAAQALWTTYKRRNREEWMPLTRCFRETIKEQLAIRAFRREFLREAVANMVAGDLDTAKAVLREYINGTVGFIVLGKAISKSPKSLMRMLSPQGNPQALNLFDIVAYLQKTDGTILEISASDAAA